MFGACSRNVTVVRSISNLPARNDGMNPQLGAHDGHNGAVEAELVCVGFHIGLVWHPTDAELTRFGAANTRNLKLHL
jgi:hypothetical protein